MKIGLFDSGIGGINVLKEFINKYKNNYYIYYGDTLNIPYGNKDSKTLLKLASKIIAFFEEKKVDLIVIACGTISSTCFYELKKITNIPIIDIISPTINYLKTINYEKAIVFGTNRTIDSHIFKNNLANITEIKTPEFVIMLENNKIDTNIIKKYLSNINSDIIILGCTHYPLLINEFEKYISKNIKIIDMGKVLVNSINISNTYQYKLDMYFSKIDDNLKINIQNIIKTKYNLYLA